MTREEAKDYIREWCPYDRQEEIIKALEQEPVLDKIRADVINIADGRRSIPVRSVINILDKHKAESEG